MNQRPTERAVVKTLLGKHLRFAIANMRWPAVSVVILLIVFSSNTLLQAAENNTWLIVFLFSLVLGCLYLAGNASKEISYNFWRRELEKKTVLYLRILPLKKSHTWATKVLATLITNIILLLLSLPIFFHGVPVFAQLFSDKKQEWGLLWWQTTMADDEFGGFLGIFLFTIAGILVLFFLIGNTPYLAEKKNQRSLPRVTVCGQNIKTEYVHTPLFLLMITLAGHALLTGWPVIFPLFLIPIFILLSYAISYLTFSDINLKYSHLKKWLLSGALIVVVIACSSIAMLIQTASSSSGAIRFASYALLRPIAEEPYLGAVMRDFQSEKEHNDENFYWYSQFSLLPRDRIISTKQTLIKLSPDELSCSKHIAALSILAMDTPPDNTYLHLLLDENSEPNFPTVGSCRMSNADMATLISLLADEDRARQLTMAYLDSRNRQIRQVGVELANKVTLNSPATIYKVQDRIVDSMARICETKNEPKERMRHLRRHDRVLQQLSLSNALFDMKGIDLENGLLPCEQIIESVLNKWRPALDDYQKQPWQAQAGLQALFGKHLPKHINIEDWWHMTAKDFDLVLSNTSNWNKLGNLARCHLANQWQLMKRTPDVDVAQTWVDWPTDPEQSWSPFSQNAFQSWDCD